MKPLISIFLLCCFMQGKVIAQQDQTLSGLRGELEAVTGEERIQLLLRLSEKIEYTSITESAGYAKEALDLSKGFNFDSLEAESLFRMGRINNIRADYAKGIADFLEAIMLFEYLGYTKRAVEAGNQLGGMYRDLGEYQQALEKYYQSLEFYHEEGNTRGIIFTNTWIGIVQREMGDYETAKRFFHDAIHLAKETDNWGPETIALAEAGFLEESRGDVDKAYEYYNSALKLFIEHKSNHGAAPLMFSIARLYQSNEQFEEALKYNREAIAIADSLENDFFAIDGLINMARIYREQNEYSSSNEVALQAVKRAEESGIEVELISSKILIASNHLDLGEVELAAEYAGEAKRLSEEIGDLGMRGASLQILVDALSANQNFSGALAYQQELMVVKDSILNTEKAKQVAEMEARYRISEREREIEKLEDENQRRSIIQLALIIGFALFGVIGFLVIRGQRFKIRKGKSDLQANLHKQQKLQEELDQKNRQLTAQSLNIVQKNEMMLELQDKVKELKEKGATKELNSLSFLVDYSLNMDEEWENFQMHFEEVHQDFYLILKQRYPDLTPNELKLSALAKLNLSIKEMATILGISPDSVKTARYRLRKKLELNTEENLTEFMLVLEKDSFREA